MNKDFRHEHVNLSRVDTWLQEVRRRVAKATKRQLHRSERRKTAEEIRNEYEDCMAGHARIYQKEAI